MVKTENNIAVNKERMRKSVKNRLSFLTSSYKKEASEFIVNKVKKMPEYREATRVMLYVATENEPDTLSLIQDCFNRGKKVVVPRCLRSGIMEAVEIFSTDDLTAGRYGIMEPKPGLTAVGPKEIDFCIVPCLAAGPDESGKYRRLGHGMGYYDRFLPLLNCCTCVLCFKELIRDEIPVDEWDRLIDVMISE